MSGPAPAAKRVGTSHILSPHDPMTVEEREAVRQELRDEISAFERYFAEHGRPWDGFEDRIAAQDEDAA